VGSADFKSVCRAPYGVLGGFDTHPLPPIWAVSGPPPVKATTSDGPGVNKSPDQLVDKFLSSRRQSTSPGTIQFYRGYLGLSEPIIGLNMKGAEIAAFL
jgi:hypothetical protein